MARINRIRKMIIFSAVLTIAVMTAAALESMSETPAASSSPVTVAEKTESLAGDTEEFPVPVAPLPKTITPCRACHGPEKDFKINWTREEVIRVHTNIRLEHGGIRVWCLDCHSPDERNFLVPLSDGKPIAFERSYELCGKCHGTKYRDWRHGIHGKRTGHWNGKKTYFLCTNCHDPHSPLFRPINPMPPPKKPRSPVQAYETH